MTPVGTLWGVHVEQFVVLQLVAVAAVLVPAMGHAAAIATLAVIGGTLVLTLTRWRGRWTYRSVFYALRRRVSQPRRRAPAESIVDELAPEVAIQEMKVGRYRNLAALFDGHGWSLCLRVHPVDARNGTRLALPVVLDTVAGLVSADGSDAPEFRVVHAALPSGRWTVPAGPGQRPMPPAAEQTWITCRVHELRGRYGDRPRPELAAVRRDLRRVVDRVTESLRARGLAVQALTVAEVRDDSRFVLGGLRHAPPEPEPRPDPEGVDTRNGWEREPWVRSTLPSPATAAAVAEQGRDETRRLAELPTQVGLGGAVHVGYHVRRWPSTGIEDWLAALDSAPASVVAVGATVRYHGAGRTAMSLTLRHTTGSAERAEAAHQAVLAAGAPHGVKLTRLDDCQVRALRATTPLGPLPADLADLDLTRFDLSRWSVEPARPRASDEAGVIFGYDTSGVPYRLPLFRPEAVWVGLLGPAELARVIASAVLHADVPVRVAGAEVSTWTGAFGADPRFDMMTPRPREQLRTQPWSPCLQILDGCDPTDVFRPLLEPWQAGLWRFDRRATDLVTHLRSVDVVLVSACTGEQADAVRQALRLDLPAATWLTDIPDGMVAVIHDGRVDRVQVDEQLRAMVVPPPSVGPVQAQPWQPPTPGLSGFLAAGPGPTEPMPPPGGPVRPRFSGPPPSRTVPLDGNQGDPAGDGPDLRRAHGIPPHLRLAPPPSSSGDSTPTRHRNGDNGHGSSGNGGRPPTST